MTQATPKACTAKVRRAAAVEDCGVRLVFIKDRGLVCMNRGAHLNPIITGFCHSGWHEGHKINKPTCTFWMVCPCECHTNISRMAALTETERVPVNNSTWVPDRHGLVSVSRAEIAEKSVADNPRIRVVASNLPGIAPDRFERRTMPTKSGRTPRGQLDMWVDEAVREWIQERPGNCTPVWLSTRIREQQGTERGPSVGAIDAVFRRWSAIGYANIGAKPTRFISFTPQGIQLGLEVLKEKAKRSA